MKPGTLLRNMQHHESQKQILELLTNIGYLPDFERCAKINHTLASIEYDVFPKVNTIRRAVLNKRACSSTRCPKWPLQNTK